MKYQKIEALIARAPSGPNTSEVDYVDISEGFGEFDKFLVSIFLSDAGKIYAKGDTTKAINYYRKAVQYGPNDSKTWYNLAGIYFTVHRYDSARICFEQTLKINPKEQQAQQALNFMNRMRK